MGIGGGGGDQKTTQTNAVPPWESFWQQRYLNEMGNLAGEPYPFPDQQFAALPMSGYAATRGMENLPGAFGNQVLGSINTLSPTYEQNVQDALNQQAATAQGAYLGPNPYLQQYYQAAARPMIQDYKNAVAPNIVAQSALQGNLGGTGEQATFKNAQSSLAQGLGNLGANIYEPAYQFERGQQDAAAQGLPSLAASTFQPAELTGAALQNQGGLYSGALGGAQTEQQQAQNFMNTNYQNAYNRANWPFRAWEQLGSAFPNISGNNQQITTQSGMGSWK